MAFTKFDFWFSLIAVFTITMISFSVFVSELDNDNLDDNSLQYINDFNNDYNGIEQETKEIGEYGSEDTLEPGEEVGDILNADVFGLFNKAFETLESVQNFFGKIYNIPTMLVRGLMLEVDHLRDIINFVGLLIFIGVLVMLMKMSNLGGSS